MGPEHGRPRTSSTVYADVDPQPHVNVHVCTNLNGRAHFNIDSFAYFYRLAYFDGDGYPRSHSQQR